MNGPEQTDSLSPLRDVRMKGFARRTPVEAVVRWIDEALDAEVSRPRELVAVTACVGRILAADLVSPVSVPGFDRSMMDGFALIAEETWGATSLNPLRFEVVGTSLPGQPFSGTIQPGQAVRIMTGAPIPGGATAVLPVEQTESDDNCFRATGEVAPGRNIGRIGEDLTEGTVVLRSGRQLRPQDAGVLSSIGCGQVPVICPPRVAILLTGNELLPPGSRPEGFRIPDSNGPMLDALVRRDGGTVCFSGLIADDRELLRRAMTASADVILVSGGSSTGQEDYAPTLLRELGDLVIHGVAMRPSSPAGMGRIGSTFVFLLPGNPVSCLCAYDFFAGRVIRGLAGRSREWPYAVRQVPLVRKIVSAVGRVDYARVRLTTLGAEPIAISGASQLSSTTSADGFVVVPADCEGFPEGGSVDVCLY